MILFALIGSALLINGTFLLFLSNFNLGVILTILAGAFFLLWGVFYEKIKKLTKSGAGKVIKYIISVLLAAELVILMIIGGFAYTDNATYTEDALIVLGAGIHGDRVAMPLALRLDKAVEYYGKNPDAVIVVTGGQGFQETVTEASAMKKYLLEKGIPSEKIIEERCATSTNENMRFSGEILSEKLGTSYTAAVVTNGFHVYRSVKIAKNEGIQNITHIGAGIQWYNLAPCYLRESLAVLKLWVLG